MGGVGSGFYGRGATKNTTDQHVSIDVRILNREGRLRSGESFVLAWTSKGQNAGAVAAEVTDDHLVLSFRNDEKRQMRQVIRLTHTQCNYGRFRVWFVCPNLQCRKRVAILYAVEEFACRNCLKLSYRSQRENIVDRGRRRAQDIRTSLGGSASLFAPFPDKPRWMRWGKYSDLRNEAQRCEAPALAGMRALLQKAKGS